MKIISRSMQAFGPINRAQSHLGGKMPQHPLTVSITGENISSILGAVLPNQALKLTVASWVR
jgi:hypothetical protein